MRCRCMDTNNTPPSKILPCCFTSTETVRTVRHWCQILINVGVLTSMNCHLPCANLSLPPRPSPPPHTHTCCPPSPNLPTCQPPCLPLTYTHTPATPLPQTPHRPTPLPPPPLTHTHLPSSPNPAPPPPADPLLTQLPDLYPMAVATVTVRLAIDVMSPRHPDEHAQSVSTLTEDGSNHGVGFGGGSPPAVAPSGTSNQISRAVHSEVVIIITVYFVLFLRLELEVCYVNAKDPQ